MEQELGAMDVTILRLPNMLVELHRSQSTDEEMDEEQERPQLRRSRRRLNSAEHEVGEEQELERRKREPAHRRRNRERVKYQQVGEGGEDALL